MRNRKRFGFTLVELLVVVGVIAVLIALLMPALTKARQAANRVACASNLRQVGIRMAMYVAQFKNYPVPVGQPGFTTSLTDWSFCIDRWTPPGSTLGLTNTATENYLFGHGVWYVGVITQDPLWYRNAKVFQCTTPTRDWVECYQARTPQLWNDTTVGVLCSNVGGQITYNPISTEGVKTPWYVYLHPFVSDGYAGPDWWDVQHAGNDVNKLLFTGGENARYRAPPSNRVVAARMKHGRRIQFLCPTVSTFASPFWVRQVFEPHGANLWTGTQNGRSPRDPEDKNYLYTDGSVETIKH